MSRKVYQTKTQAKRKQDKYLTANTYTGDYDLEQLQEIRRILAGRANKSLMELQKNKSSISGESYISYGAGKDAIDWLKERGRRYFRTTIEEPPKTRDERAKAITREKREIRELQYFLNRPSSTVAGHKEIERIRQETLASKGITFTGNKEFYDFMNSDTLKGYIKAGFTSETLADVYSQLREADNSDEESLKKLRDALDDFRKAESGDAENEANIKNLLRKTGLKNSGNRRDKPT
jgi:hypothetical protein